MAGPDAPDVVLAGMSREVASIRASMDQFLGGIRPTEEAQVQQARVVQRVQTSLERLASHGQVAHRVLPPNVLHLLLEKGDRPAAGSDAAASAQLYETFGTGLDADDPQVAESSQAALSQHASWRRVPAEMRAAWQAVGAARAKTFPAACKPPRARKREVGDAAVTGAGDLPARFVIHAAGMPLGGSATEETVRSCMRRSLELAREKECRTVAVPAIGAGIAGFPVQRCAEILRDLVQCDGVCFALLDDAGATIEAVHAARATFSACNPEVLQGTALDTLPWLQAGLDHLRLRGIADTALPPPEQATDAARFAQLRIGAFLACYGSFWPLLWIRNKRGGFQT